MGKCSPTGRECWGCACVMSTSTAPLPCGTCIPAVQEKESALGM